MSERHELAADARVDKGGGGNGFGAHELLEAALAACINMAVRMYATNHSIPLQGTSTRVKLDRTTLQTARLEYALEYSGSMTDDQRRQIDQAACDCPVRQTPSKRIEFKALT